MRRARNNPFICGAIIAVVLILATGCSGGGDSAAPQIQDTSGSLVVVGDVSNPAPTTNPGTATGGGQVISQPSVPMSDSAPLGTNPEFGTQPIANLITTTKISDSTSTVRTSSEDSEGNILLWVAVAKRGQEPIPGSDAPPLAEGDQIDLYIRYKVVQGFLNISREWYLEEAGLNYIEPNVSHPEPGTYQAVFPFVLPYGTAIDEAVFRGKIGPQRSGSIFVIPDSDDMRSVLFNILDTATLPPIHYPAANPDELNDSEDHAKGCLPEYIYVEFYGNYISVESDMAPSNVRILTESGEFFLFESLPEDLYQVFYAPNGETITDAWIKVGCNEGGDGSGFGEHFNYQGDAEEMAMAQFAWDDDSVSSDFDYNDFVGRMRISEIRNESNEMVMMFMTAKAMARGSTNIADWQFNVDASFPGATEVYAVVQQFHADGTVAAPQAIYQSVGGASFPVFAPTADAFPGAGADEMVNVLPGSNYIDGDYAEVLVILNDPQPQGTYSPIPYEPELLVSYDDGSSEAIPLWSEIGDDLRADGFPQAFIVPDTYAWALEEETIYGVYPEFHDPAEDQHDWIEWINGKPPEPAPPWWQYPPYPTSSYFDYDLFGMQ